MLLLWIWHLRTIAFVLHHLLYMMPCGLYGQHTLMYKLFLCVWICTISIICSPKICLCSSDGLVISEPSCLQVVFKLYVSLRIKNRGATPFCFRSYPIQKMMSIADSDSIQRSCYLINVEFLYFCVLTWSSLLYRQLLNTLMKNNKWTKYIIIIYDKNTIIN